MEQTGQIWRVGPGGQEGNVNLRLSSVLSYLPCQSCLSYPSNQPNQPYPPHRPPV
jgi:hypothetical protein